MAALIPKFDSRRSGVSAIEIALLLPLIILILFGVIEYGWMFLKAEQLNAAARHGVRVGVVEAATNAEVNAAVDQLMLDAGLAASGYVITLAPTDVSLVPAGDSFTVTVTVPYANITLTNLPILPMPTSLKGSTTMAKEG